MAIILDEHLKIDNAKKLAEYVQKQIKIKHKNDVHFEITNVSDNYFSGFINDAPFVIIYFQGINCSIEITEGYPVATKILTNAIQPAMLKISEEARNPDCFTRPLLSYYSNRGSKVVEWDVYDPLERLKCIAYQVKNGLLEVDELEIYYKNLTLKDMDEYLKFGSFSGFLTGNEIRMIDQFSEVETYLYLRNAIINCEEADAQGKEDEADAYTYNICYVLQTLKKYGVEVNPPADEPQDLTAEANAWFSWWSEGINLAVQEDPEITEKWANLPKGCDTSFRPKGSFTDYLEEQKEEKAKD